MSVKEEIKDFIGINSNLNVTLRDDVVHIVGYYDDLDPEPERSKIESTLGRLELDLQMCDEDEFSFSITNIYGPDRSYGQIKIKLKIEQ